MATGGGCSASEGGVVAAERDPPRRDGRVVTALPTAFESCANEKGSFRDGFQVQFLANGAIS